ncbi:MAG TPA: DEAD/DEAH box helicase family protein [Candidatus Saccharibacteria bacterium]|nr:DEAD/DEAH box helicase family protein [Candidatus Saccharibacteria bacterium]
MLSDLDIKLTYSSAYDDIVNDFFIPTLKQSISYDRVAGYFSPSVLALASVGIASFVKEKKGKIRIICSVNISSKLCDAIMEDDGSKISLDEMSVTELTSELEKDYYRLFVKMLNAGIIELKIVAMDNAFNIFHSKIGILKDSAGNAVSFVGSVNETSNAWQGNIEDYPTFTSWRPGGQEYIDKYMSIFEAYWNGDIPRSTTFSLSKSVINRIQEISGANQFETTELVKKIESKLVEEKKKPYKYQLKAIENWKNANYNGIFAMATGTGKTFTALCGLKDYFLSSDVNVAIVVVPLAQLVYQWVEEIKDHEFFAKANIIMAPYARDWKKTIKDELFYNSGGNNLIVVTTYSTFFTEDFIKIFKSYGKTTMLIADEVHNVAGGARLEHSDFISEFHSKLGLSATPLSIWSEDNSNQMIDLFGGVVYEYSLEKALKKNDLTNFDYEYFEVPLTQQEFEEYVDLSKKIYPKTNEDKKLSGTSAEIKRANIKKNAEQKVLMLEKKLATHSFDIKKTLIYANDQIQLDKIQKMMDVHGLKTSRFTGEEKNPVLRKSIIENLEDEIYDAVVAIKCLDEGVDIRSAQTAYLISNNTEPREYTQRLGRVLRKCEGKKLSYVVDFVVVPPESFRDNKYGKQLVKNELKRVGFFSDLASNSSDVAGHLIDTKLKYGI